MWPRGSRRSVARAGHGSAPRARGCGRRGSCTCSSRSAPGTGIPWIREPDRCTELCLGAEPGRPPQPTRSTTCAGPGGHGDTALRCSWPTRPSWHYGTGGRGLPPAGRGSDQHRAQRAGAARPVSLGVGLRGRERAVREAPHILPVTSGPGRVRRPARAPPVRPTSSSVTQVVAHQVPAEEVGTPPVRHTTTIPRTPRARTPPGTRPGPRCLPARLPAPVGERVRPRRRLRSSPASAAAGSAGLPRNGSRGEPPMTLGDGSRPANGVITFTRQRRYDWSPPHSGVVPWTSPSRTNSRPLGLTYDDVLLLPGASDVVPSEVDTASG